MNTKLLLSSLICGLCFTVAAHANTKSNTDQLAQKYVQVCKSKKQGDMVSFAQKGVIFNGVCQPNDAGKLVFQPPMPASNAMPETQSFPVNWLQIHITVDQNQVELTETLLLSLGAVSVTLDDAEDQALLEPLPGETPLWNKVIVTGIYQQDEEDPIDVDTLEAFLKAQLPDVPMRHEYLENQVWERAWMDYYEPIQIGEKYWIVPEWLEPPEADATNIKLDPGLAFGTGNHASTFLCLQWLGKTDVKDKIVIDYGCGSGILGVAALLLGAKKVYATDIDPQAVLATKQNAELNGVLDRLYVGLPEEFDQEFNQQQADVLVANILAAPLMALAPEFSTLIKSEGEFALAGVIEEQVADVSSVYSEFFDILDIEKREENWCRISGKRKTTI
ncbi:UNVERIFIED_CONTAM: prmA [Trichonephila clavipes]